MAPLNGAAYVRTMQFLIVPFDSESRELDRVLMGAGTPFELVKERARELLLLEDAVVVIVSNGVGDELWRYPAGFDV